jgi:DNA-binding transcriptional ArsR family regulator
MKEGPLIASVAALIGDPARANILTALMDGRALTASELAGTAGVGLSTASGHLAKLTEARLLSAEKQGRHRYFRLAAPDVAEVLEGLMGLAQRTGAVRVRTGPRDEALRKARVCYDHLAGEEGVALLSRLFETGVLKTGEQPVVSAKGHSVFRALGIDVSALEGGRRPLCLSCLDWSERRHHLGGSLGAAILRSAIERGWVARGEGRVLKVTPAGRAAFQSQFGEATSTRGM